MSFEDFDRFLKAAPATTKRSMRMAINTAARFARSEASKGIRGQVRFTRSYLSNARGRLTVKKATSGDMEAVVTGRNRPTSLARFATPGKRVRVRVKRVGARKILKRGFFVRLRTGNTDKKDNIGLAVRTRKGERPSNTMGGKPIFDGRAYLLYGPSVGQVARDVFPDVLPSVGQKMRDEFYRNFERFS